MMRIGLLSLAITLIFVATAAASDAAQTFAIDQLRRHLSQISSRKYSIDVSVDPSVGTGAEAFVVEASDNRIKIIGSNGNATLQAAYWLLDRAGCRFLAPQLSFYQDAAQILPAKSDLVLTIPRTLRTPALRFRKIYVEEGHSHTIENLKQIVEWMPKVGYNTLVVPANYQGAGRVTWDNWRVELTPELQKRGITIEVGGHGYQNFLNADMEAGKLFEQHPEWFGQDAGGTRHREKAWVFCTSNSQAVEQLTKNFVDYVKARPEIEVYDFWPPDGARWCECDQCKKLGTASDRQAILVPHVQQRVRELRPDLRLEIIAYAAALLPPEHQTLDKNILVDFCPINQQFDRQIDDPDAPKNKPYAGALVAWRRSFAGDISIYSYYRKYAWNSLPVIIPHYMQTDLKWYAKRPVQGVSTYAEPGDWATYELNHYVLAALAWEPDAAVDAIVKKFCAARYGEFANEAASVLMTLEDITRKTCSIPNTPLKSRDEIDADCGRAAKMEQGSRAAAARAGDPAVKRALERLALICEYARRDLEIQKLRAATAPADEIKSKATALHEFLSQHADDGVFLMHNQRLSVRSVLNHYGVRDR